MARVPLIDAQASPAVAAIATRIRAQRGGRLLNLYRVLLNSPRLAEGWLEYMTVIRQQCALPARYRELAILRVAVLNGASYEFEQHVPYARTAGLDDAQIACLRTGDDPPGCDDADLRVLRYVDAMTRDIRVPASVFEPLAAMLPDAQVVELTATVAAYNMVSRFLEALQVDHD